MARYNPLALIICGSALLTGCFLGGGAADAPDGIRIDGNTVTIKRGPDELVCRKSGEQIKTIALFQVIHSPKFGMDGVIFGMDLQEYRRHKASYAHFDPFNSKSQGYDSARRHFYKEPFVLPTTKLQTLIEEFKAKGRLQSDPPVILLKGNPLSVQKYRYNGFSMQMNKGAASSPWLITTFEDRSEE